VIIFYHVDLGLLSTIDNRKMIKIDM